MYKIASGKIRTSNRLTYTTGTRSTIMHMFKHFVSEDREDSDNELHGKIRKEIKSQQARLTIKLHEGPISLINIGVNCWKD